MKGNFVPALRFKALTRFYDPVVRLTTRERRVKQALIAATDTPEGATVLDLGCGTGTMSIWIKQQHPGARVIGVDLDPVILDIARVKAEQAGVAIEFIEASAADTLLPNDSVDRVVSSLFFHHLMTDQKLQVIHEMFRILAADGEVHISDWGRPANSLMRSLFFFVQLLDGFPTTNDSVAGRLPELLAQAGGRHVHEHTHFNTVLGTLRLVEATK